MKHQLKQIFSSSKFVMGFVIFICMITTAIVYPLISSYGPLEMVGSIFYEPGTYVAVGDVIETSTKTFNIDTSAVKLEKNFSVDERERMKDWLIRFGGQNADDIDIEDANALIKSWHDNFDASNPQQGLLSAEKKAFVRLNTKLENILKDDTILAGYMESGEFKEIASFHPTDYVRVDGVATKIHFPLGTDNFGADVLTKLTSAILVSLRIGLIAGLVATTIGLTIGLLAGFVGGMLDNILTFITNIFTVIPGFVILILIANSVDQAARGPSTVAVIIGLTAWPWTARSVRSQVLTLRGRDHVSLSKLSGHSLPRIVLVDILPYIASYVVMALILQISSGILAEAQLSMLGLGPQTTTTTTLGLMMNWANQFQATLTGAWWAIIPVILSVALISFSLNLMNTGLDQVFNPQLRDD